MTTIVNRRAAEAGCCRPDKQDEPLKSNGQLLESLSHSEMFQNYRRAYVDAVGLPLSLRPVESWRLPFQGSPKENAFCALMGSQSHTCAACLQLQGKLTRASLDKPATRMCAYGLCETAVPVKLGPETIGFLQTGQVLRQTPSEASFQRAVKYAATCGADIDDAQTKRAYFQTPVFTQTRIDAVAGLLSAFADHLAMRGNQLMMQATHGESPLVTKAKEYIRDHFTENLSLNRVSKVVNTSRFYFCKQFRKSTGLVFTEFVSRTRVERATNLLLNPNLRICEIAFAVGFESLVHFSRMFKKINGRSASAYRARLKPAPTDRVP